MDLKSVFREEWAGTDSDRSWDDVCRLDGGGGASATEVTLGGCEASPSTACDGADSVGVSL
eukprot:3102542-Pleurochrysis_carterae.AAC.1